MSTVGWIRAEIVILFPIVRRQIGRAFDIETIFKSHEIIKYEWLNHCSPPEAGRTWTESNKSMRLLIQFNDRALGQRQNTWKCQLRSHFTDWNCSRCLCGHARIPVALRFPFIHPLRFRSVKNKAFSNRQRSKCLVQWETFATYANFYFIILSFICDQHLHVYSHKVNEKNTQVVQELRNEFKLNLIYSNPPKEMTWIMNERRKAQNEIVILSV